MEQALNSDGIEIVLQAGNVWEWIQKYRPNVGGDTRNFGLIPFWKEFYLDPHKRKGALCGRQVYKSTAATDYLSYISTTGSFRNAMYVIHDPTSMESFSTERVRQGTFMANHSLAPFLPYGKRAAVKTINLTNHSRITFRHSQNHYANTEGQTADITVVDEIQKQNLSKFRILKHTIRAKNAPLIMFGIGAEEGTTFHDMIMNESDIYDWRYKDRSPFTDEKTGKKWNNQGWRHNLTFDESGIITNSTEQLETILDGELVKIHSAYNDAIYKFYHFPQEIFPTIPLTISDSKRYNRDIDQSIEYQQIHDPDDVFQAHCMGWFHAARGRPLTLDIIRKCYNDHVSFLTPNEIKSLKEKYKNALVVTAGIDWGSNREGKSNTVFTVLLCWKKTPYSPEHYQIAYQKVFGVESSDAEEALNIIPLIQAYHIDNTAGDIGFGKSGMKIIKDTIGRSHIHSVFTSGNLLEETHTYQMDIEHDEKKFGIKNDFLSVHKTERVDHLIGIIKSTIPDDTDPTNKRKATPKLVIPHENPLDVETLERGLLKIEREDLIVPTINSDIDKRQKPEKKYLHYKDEVSALIHAFIAFENYDPSQFKINVIKPRR